MGYRSDVAYAIRFKSREHRIRFMATQALDPKIDLADFKLVGDDVVLLHFEAVKWYEDYDDVKAHKRLLDDAKSQGCAWEFCRVGEETGDIESESDYSIDDLGHEVYPPELIQPSQSVYIHEEGEAYPVDERI
jgi:hypothetical protein